MLTAGLREPYRLGLNPMLSTAATTLLWTVSPSSIPVSASSRCTIGCGAASCTSLPACRASARTLIKAPSEAQSMKSSADKSTITTRPRTTSAAIADGRRPAR